MPPTMSPVQPLRRRANMRATSVEVGPGSRLARAYEVEEFLLADPVPAPDELAAHHREM